MSKEYQLYLTSQRTEAEKKAFLAGCRAMLTAFRCTPTDQYPQLYSSMTETHILATLISTDQYINDQRTAEVSAIMNACSYDKLQARAFIFNVARIDDLGREIDEHGAPIESINYVQFPDTVHRPYPNQQIQHRLTGQVISQSDYNRLPTKFQADYEFVRSMELTLHGRPILKITSYDYSLICQLIRNDILIGDCRSRYLLAVADGGVLEEYRSVVINTISELGDESHFTPILIAHVDSGFITTPGHLLIAQIQSLIRGANPTAFFRSLTETDLSTWYNVIRACKEDLDLSRIITDQDFMTYLNADTTPLRQATCKDGNWETTPFYAETAHGDAEILTLRKNYFQHILIPRFCHKLIGLLGTNLTEESYHLLPPDGHETLLQLAKLLLEYYPNDTDTSPLRSFLHNHDEDNEDC